MGFALLLANLLLACFMAGIIWVIQVVHYPLFAAVGEAGWGAYHAQHSARISAVVLLPMVLELALSVGLLLFPPAGLTRAAALLLLALTVVTWGVTALLAVPAHNRLAGGWAPEAHRALLASNWLRTAAWSARTVLLAALLWSVRAAPPAA